ncbi:mitochondrial 54S ribosomal protein mrpl1 [Ascosphaera acerosa]|nr:mitochondrial 54S ribosomal protein mrpl1 [Ascosphaera acerosa]
MSLSSRSLSRLRTSLARAAAASSIPPPPPQPAASLPTTPLLQAHSQTYGHGHAYWGPASAPAARLPSQPHQQARHASTDFMSRVRAKKREAAKASAPKKRRTFRAYDMKDAIQWSLCDAIRYIRAFEVGQDLDSVKYELHVRLKTRRNGAVLRNNINLPHPFQPQARIAVVCAPGSKAAAQAAAAGVAPRLIGEDALFAQIKAGAIAFDKCICHTASVPALGKAQVGRILGPRGLMPSAKLGTVTDNIAAAVQSMRVGSAYRERNGVVNLGIGRLGFSPEMLRDNIAALVAQMRKDMAAIADESPKDIAEVVLSSTHAPGFSLTGEFRSDASLPSEQLTGH